MRVLAAIIHDVRFQFRHGFYYAYLLVCALYVLVLRYLPVDWREVSTVLVIFTDPAVLGFFFIGAIVLLEKGLNILESLFVTPLRMREYFVAKVTSLTLIAVLSSVGIVVAVFGTNFHLLPLILGVALGSIFTTLLGLTLVVRVKTVNGYLIASPVYLILLMLPVVDYLQVFPARIFSLMPARATLVLLEGALGKINGSEMLVAVLVMAVWIWFAYLWASRWFYKYIILRIGG